MTAIADDLSQRVLPTFQRSSCVQRGCAESIACWDCWCCARHCGCLARLRRGIRLGLGQFLEGEKQARQLFRARLAEMRTRRKPIVRPRFVRRKHD